MKKSLVILGLLLAAKAFGGDDIKVSLDSVSAVGVHSNIAFECKLHIHNGTSAPLVVTNFYGLALKVSDLDGKELQRIRAHPFIAMVLWTIPANGDSTNDKVLYGFGSSRYDSLSLPDSVQAVRVQAEVTLPGSNYTNHLASNVVEVKVP